jgi:hypothetical protein
MSWSRSTRERCQCTRKFSSEPCSNPDILRANAQEIAEVKYCEELGGGDVDWIQVQRRVPVNSLYTPETS